MLKEGISKNYYKIDDEQQGKIRINTEEFINDPSKQFAHISKKQIKVFKNKITTQYNKYSVMLKYMATWDMNDAVVRLKNVF